MAYINADGTVDGGGIIFDPPDMMGDMAKDAKIRHLERENQQLRSRVRRLEEFASRVASEADRTAREGWGGDGLVGWALSLHRAAKTALAPAPATPPDEVCSKCNQVHRCEGVCMVATAPATCRCDEMAKLLQAAVSAAEQHKDDFDALANWLACHIDQWGAELERRKALAQPQAEGGGE
jgi:hypothetical protein